jgi:hypothetical protein
VSTMTPEHEIDERNAARDLRVLNAARRVIETNGLSALTREALADEARVSAASVSNFGRTRITNGEHDREGYRPRILRALMDAALESSDLPMLRVGIADGCLRLEDLPVHLRLALKA